MTQDDIDELARSKQSLDTKAKEYNITVSRIQKYIGTLNAKCDHKYPDGRSAIPPDTYFCNVCNICGWSDL